MTLSSTRRSSTALNATIVALWAVCTALPARGEESPELILHHGKILAVDADFGIHEALAVRGGRIVQIGNDADVLKLRGTQTELVDLDGKLALPGLIDSHVHPSDASLTEFDHEIPDLKTIADVLAHIRARAKVVAPGEWIDIHQVFITRLAEQRYPTRAELDAAAPEHPVAFATGPDISLSTLGLAKLGIDKDFQAPGGGEMERDPASGEPTGILHGCNRFLKIESTHKQPTAGERLERLRLLFKDYNASGITTIGDKAASTGALDQYRQLAAAGQLTVRIGVSRHIDTDGRLEAIQEAIRQVGADPLVVAKPKSKPEANPQLWIVGIKTFLDGGMLTGSALMREPWGVSQIYSIRDPEYRGVRFIPEERLVAIVETTVQNGLQFTAHAVGDGAVEALLAAYDQVDRRLPIRGTRPSITHSNFMSRKAIDEAARLGVVVDIQPIWLYLDGRTLANHFGLARLRYFQPLHSLFESGVVAGGGSDHMQKIGALRAINIYEPFLGMQTTVARKARGLAEPIHPEEALDRRQMIRFYTANNAILLRREQDIGSLEVGKLADLIVVDTDLLECPVEAIANTKVLATYLGGQRLPK